MRFADFLGNQQNNNVRFFKFLSTIIAVLGLFLALNFIAPTFVSVVLNIFMILLIVIVLIFLALGTLVIFGMRKEVSRALDILLEGSLTILDFIQLIKELWKQFIETLKEFLIFAAPVFAFILSLIAYLLTLMLYKWVGKDYDVTILTIVLTFVLVFMVGVLNKPSSSEPDLTVWKNRFGKVFKSSFVDSTEVMLFVFFLTMDSENLFFLPAYLNVPLKADLLGFDLMRRSFVVDNDFKYTIYMIVFAISNEILRNVLRVVAVAREYYSQSIYDLQDQTGRQRMNLIKESLRLSFVDLKEDIIKFIAFTTVLFAVFMLFPRLKLLTLVVASVSALMLDLIFVSRLVQKRGSDLITRLIIKVFRL